jgi:hypothetical protein
MEGLTKVGENRLPPKPAPKPGIYLLFRFAFNFVKED